MVVLSEPLPPCPGVLVGLGPAGVLAADTGQTVVYKGMVTVVTLPMGQLVMVGLQLVMVWMAVVYTVEVVISTDEVVWLDHLVVVKRVTGEEVVSTIVLVNDLVVIGALVVDEVVIVELPALDVMVVVLLDPFLEVVLVVVPVVLVEEAVEVTLVVLEAVEELVLVVLEAVEELVLVVLEEVVKVVLVVDVVLDVVVVFGAFWLKMRISLTLKNTLSKAEGVFATKSRQVAPLSWAAQESQVPSFSTGLPHKSMLRIIRWSLKILLMSQFDFFRAMVGFPQVEVSGESVSTFLGTSFHCHEKTLI